MHPEKSIDTNLDLIYMPPSLPGATLQLSYYNIFYRQRIEYPTPDTADPLSDRNIAPFLTRDPLDAEIERISSQSQFTNMSPGGTASKTDATLIIDDRNQNIAHQRASGVDFLSQYICDTRFGRLDSSLNVAYLELLQKVTKDSASTRLSATLYYPPSWRMRVGVNWRSNPYLASIFFNYTGGSRALSSAGDPAVSPNKGAASWATVDGQIGIIFSSNRIGGDTRVTLSAENMFDRHPPLISSSHLDASVNYDSTNTSPVGRFLTLQITQVW